MTNRELGAARDYWNTEEAVASQHAARPFLHWQEAWLLAEVNHRLPCPADRVRLVHAIGCGTGRELPAILEAFPAARVVASDLAPAMLERCAVNLAAQGLGGRVELRLAAASTLEPESSGAEVVFLLDNLLTYVTPGAERLATVTRAAGLAAPGGVLAGLVHHRWGRPMKSLYFGLRASASWFMARDTGDRRYRYRDGLTTFHYFTRRELVSLLGAGGWEGVEAWSLHQLGHLAGRPYRGWTGDNNLVFMARRAHLSAAPAGR